LCPKIWSVLLNMLQIPSACTSSPPFIPMILRFGLLMESASSCLFLSQVLSCLTHSSSVFPLIFILSSNSEILSYTCSSLLEWPSIVFCVSVSFFFLRFSNHWSLPL
jgi:Mn2+/Fe2+ NRAMP family transporter